MIGVITYTEYYTDELPNGFKIHKTQPIETIYHVSLVEMA